MLQTLFGNLLVSRDGQPVTYELKQLEKTKHCPQVNGRYVVYIAATAGEKVRCEISSAFTERAIESGENLEALSFYNVHAKLTIGVEADFLVQQGHYTARGIEITATGPVRFGVCWIEPVSEANDVQTWYGADLFGIEA